MQDEIVEWLCECAVQAGQVATVEACVAELDDGFTDAQQACLGKELDKDASAQAAIDCMADAMSTYIACLEDQGCVDQSQSFMCDDGQSIPQGWVCDGENDCANGEDEANCSGAAQTCDAAYYQTQNSCPQISDASIEAAYSACGIETPEDFTCNDGETIPGDWECDGVDDCVGGEDEANCA